MEIIMEQIFALMTGVGALLFICFGVCGANSIEANENETLKMIFAFLTFLSGISFIVGFIGLIVVKS